MSDNPRAPLPAPSPSPPPSPLNEEDLSGAHRWSDDEAEHLDPYSKGKGKGRQLHLDEEDADTQEYPPVAEDEAETRRIEENLRRWEVAERAKRKAAREATDTTPDTPQSTSLLGHVARRASWLWSGGDVKTPHPDHNLSRGTHTALDSRESVDSDVPLDDIAETPTPSPTVSGPSNPFSDRQAVMSPSAEPLPPTPQLEKDDAIPMKTQRPALLAASSSIRRPPTPKPLGLPPPRAPPPPLPQNSPPPEPLQQQDAEAKETRWWHEWLCGLGEGSDRGGDNQAARTNPFE
ncbi:hypothetical protein GGX14DRAFT_630392, partial [Mycena pura]